MCFAGGTSLSEDDALDPVVTDHATPQSVVEIENKTFLRQPSLRGQDAGDHIAVYRGRLRSNFQLSLKPAPGVEPRGNSVAFAGARDVEKQYAILARRLT